MERHDVLIVGAGPTGLVFALWLVKQGVKVGIIDKNTGPGATSRAMGVQARTLELYRQLDIADEVVAAGQKNPAINLWVKGRQKARVSFGSAGARLTPYPFLLIYPQDRHEQLLVRHLERMGVTVQRQTELLDFREQDDCVSVTTRNAQGLEQVCEARFLAACDGASSPIRHQLEAGFAGGTYEQIFYVADIQASGPVINGEAHLALESSDFLALFSYSNDGRGRLIGTVRDDRVGNAETLTFDDVSHHAIESLGLKVDRVNWFSTYRVHHRVADHYRYGRVFLLGDAAHIHSPAGGQGMNTGIGDAINLAWKLAAVLKREAPDRLLDSYEVERLAFARQLVDTTDRLFTFVTTEGSVADFVRTQIAPLFVSTVYRIDASKKFMFRLISQIMINYESSPLSVGSAGKVKGGDRLPWASWDGRDNYGSLDAIDWQLHVYGAAQAELKACCKKIGIPLYEFDWHAAHKEAGFARDAAYLLRPDTYVALAISDGSAAVLERYFTERDYSRFAS